MFQITIGNKTISFGRRKDATINSLVSGNSLFGSQISVAEKNQSQALRENRGWVFKCVNLISNSVSSGNLSLYTTQKGKKAPVKDHPFLGLWEKPNVMFTGRQLLKLCQTHLELCGEAYLLVLSTPGGMPKELWPLQPDHVDIKIGRDGTHGFKYQPPGKPPTLYSSEDVIYLRYPHPTKALRGRSPLQATSLEYDTDKLIEEYYWTLFKEGGWFHYALSADNTLTETQAKQIQTAWMKKIRTPAGKFTPPVLPRGLKITQLNQSSLTLGTKEKSLDLRDKILSAYGVPRGLLGITEGLPRANLDGAEYMFAKDTIKPRLGLWGEVLTKFAKRYRGEQVAVQFERVIPRDKEAFRLETDMLLNRGALTISEARERHGFNPDFKDGDTVLIPINVRPVSQK